MIVKEKMLLNGAKYSGNIENNIPHGYGVYETNNLKYEGYFYNGLFDSFGILTDKVRNYKYEGYFKLGNKEGFGQISFNDGRYFEGIFKGNSANGIGYMKYSDGEIYVGEFKNNLADGDGTVYYANGNIYTGQFKNDKECGLGVVMEKDNRSYGIKVEYKEDGYTLIHGQIKLTSELNTHMVYRIVENNDYLFFGMIDKYSNLIKGIYHYKNHKDFKTFIGNISEEFKNGLLIFNNNNLYTGFIENDELTGKGELNVLGKGKYVGEFFNGIKNGEFKFIDYDGEEYHHIYDNDKLSNTRKEIQ
ncbi:MAG: hypothetical protein J6Y28_08270 [Acholeplasmatales bacterium]|nr:hypothetical protein [Acholeplasmatales bacterium]